MIGTIVVEWDGTPASGPGLAELAPRLTRLRELGVDVVLRPAPGAGDVPGGLGLAPPGLGRLVVQDTSAGATVEMGDPATVPAACPAGDGGPPRPSPPEEVVVVQAGSAAALELLEGTIAAHAGFPEMVRDPAWLLEVDGFDAAHERQVESWLTVGNGRTGTRGSLEEDGAHSEAALYVAGVYGRVGAGQPSPDLVRGPDWVHLRPRAGGSEVRVDQDQAVEHRRVLDLRQGIVFRQWRQPLPSGGCWSFRSARLASLADRQLLMVEAEAEAGDATVSLGDGIPPPVGQQAVASVRTTRDGAGPEVVDLRADGGGAFSFAASTEESGGRLERLAAVRRELPGAAEEDPRTVLSRARAAGVPTLRARHCRAWRDRWHDADVVVDGDVDLQRAVRFALHHLIAGADPESDAASVGARGLTGPGYAGHVFWDTEVFVLPFHIWTHPETARALLAYRHRTLPAARAKAAAFGYEGALYAWESADTGEETTPRCVLMSDGTPIDVLTGVQEHHISGDVAWATWRYWQVTGDDAFLVEMGAEMILEAARFWASRAQAGTDGRYHIREVIGPDEYHEGVDDNAFTNVLARWNLRTAAQVWEVLAELDGPARGALGARLRLDEAEVARWAGVGAGLVDGFDPETLLYEQFTGFFGYEDVRAADHGTRPFPGDTVLGVERVRHSQMVKQADVVMLAHVLPELVPVEVAAANYGYYEPRTSHGSSLSPAVHAAVAARIGRFDDADAYFRMAAGMDLDRRVGDASKGLHVATMGGLWQAAVLGFGGVAPDGPALRLDPRLPPSWDGLRFSLRWRGTPVHVALTADEVRIDLGGPTVLAVGRGAPSTYGAGQLTARRQGDGWAVPEPVTAR